MDRANRGCAMTGPPTFRRHRHPPHWREALVLPATACQSGLSRTGQPGPGRRGRVLGRRRHGGERPVPPGRGRGFATPAITFGLVSEQRSVDATLLGVAPPELSLRATGVRVDESGRRDPSSTGSWHASGRSPNDWDDAHAETAGEIADSVGDLPRSLEGLSRR